MKCLMLIAIISFSSVLFSQTETEKDYALITTSYGEIIIEFFEDVAPMHVESFKILAKEKYFDGTTFHRVIPKFVIQGGDPNSKLEDRTQHGTGGRAGKFYGVGDEDKAETWTIPAEFNDHPHNRGAVSMARTSDPNSASSQFFICVDNVNQLDNQYTVFGQVVKGIEVIDKIVNLPRDKRDNPLEAVTMSVRVISKKSKM